MKITIEIDDESLKDLSEIEDKDKRNRFLFRGLIGDPAFRIESLRKKVRGSDHISDGERNALINYCNKMIQIIDQLDIKIN